MAFKLTDLKHTLPFLCPKLFPAPEASCLPSQQPSVSPPSHESEASGSLTADLHWSSLHKLNDKVCEKEQCVVIQVMISALGLLPTSFVLLGQINILCLNVFCGLSITLPHKIVSRVQ